MIGDRHGKNGWAKIFDDAMSIPASPARRNDRAL
jgi:hypothetical protein